VRRVELVPLPALLFALAAAPHSGGNDVAPVTPSTSVPAPAEHVLQIQAKELWTTGGERITDGLLVIADGRIRSVGAGKKADPSLPLLYHDGVVTAGLIACRSQAGSGGELQDDTRTILGAARTEYAFDASSHDFARALAAGITALEIAPSAGNLVGGLACVVKTSGGRVVTPEAALALSLTGAALGRASGPNFFAFGAAEGEEPPLVQRDGGPESTDYGMRGNREPTSYAGALATLRKLFAQGAGPFGRAKHGELQVTIEAWDRNEVVRASALAKELGLKGSIRGAPLAGDPDVVASLKASGLGVVVGPYGADQVRRSIASVKLLSEAGVPVAFALDDPAHAPLELRLSAVRALQSGAAPAAVWKALTEDAARLAGVGETLGALAPEHDADVVLWSGDPFDLRSRVVAVYVDGQRAWPAPSAH
jgi:imidazolonepropionase-like amidohydrolase